MINILLCGGSGTRLWPISRKLAPKQFNKIFNGESLFQQTALRNGHLCNEFLIVAGEDQYFMAQDQLEEINSKNKVNFILEPVGRNTAPAIALACKDLDPNTIVFVTPTDHRITKLENFHTALKKAKDLAEKGYLVTFGIKPTHPETGFGYIKANGEDVEQFVEKPNLEKATEYMQSGKYFWNSGMFCFKAKTFMDELKRFRSDIYEASQINFKKNGNLHRLTLEEMKNIPSESIDYAVMEKSKLVKVVTADLGWSDVGSFDAIYNELDKDKNGNTISKNHVNINSHGNLIMTSNKTVATIDIDDLILIDTEDALLVSKKGSTQKVKNIVEEIQKIKPELAQIHTTGYRPWGHYQVLLESENYKVKKIYVKPNSRLSLQKHAHRNEHWIVIEGEATVTVDDKIVTLKANQSTYIPQGAVHRLENKTSKTVAIIEVQVGSYVGEDDIVRLQDDYQRN